MTRDGIENKIQLEIINIYIIKIIAIKRRWTESEEKRN
jgi:hypothetical protein